MATTIIILVTALLESIDVLSIYHIQAQAHILSKGILGVRKCEAIRSSSYPTILTTKCLMSGLDPCDLQISDPNNPGHLTTINPAVKSYSLYE